VYHNFIVLHMYEACPESKDISHVGR